MIIHTNVMSIGGKLFSFYMKINRLSQVSFGPCCLRSVRGPSALDKFNLTCFSITCNDNTYIYNVHRWYTFFVLYVN